MLYTFRYMASSVCACALQALLQAHTDRLDQQHQAENQNKASEHAAELRSATAALRADLQQQMQAAVEETASKQAGQVTHSQQLLQKAEALLAAEKQKSASLKVMQQLVIDFELWCTMQNSFSDFTQRAALCPMHCRQACHETFLPCSTMEAVLSCSHWHQSTRRMVIQAVRVQNLESMSHNSRQSTGDLFTSCFALHSHH